VSKRVLVVDDEEDVRSIVQLALNLKTDWEVILAASGKEALDLAAKNQPDLILLDLMMPEMDGTATLQALKTNFATIDIPVILVTAKVDRIEEKKLSELDIIGVLAKPFRPLQLSERIVDLLSRRSR
jgi:CheY-like chemotaxis protein